MSPIGLAWRWFLYKEPEWTWKERIAYEFMLWCDRQPGGKSFKIVK